jgi:hypothetical protein
MIVLRFRFRLFCSRMCALSLTLERETHIISLVRVDTVPCACQFRGPQDTGVLSNTLTTRFLNDCGSLRKMLAHLQY